MVSKLQTIRIQFSFKNNERKDSAGYQYSGVWGKGKVGKGKGNRERSKAEKWSLSCCQVGHIFRLETTRGRTARDIITAECGWRQRKIFPITLHFYPRNAGCVHQTKRNDHFQILEITRHFAFSHNSTQVITWFKINANKLSTQNRKKGKLQRKIDNRYLRKKVIKWFIIRHKLSTKKYPNTQTRKKGKLPPPRTPDDKQNGRQWRVATPIS